MVITEINGIIHEIKTMLQVCIDDSTIDEPTARLLFPVILEQRLKNEAVGAE